MENNKIIVHQAFYGEVNKAHSCIYQTIQDPDLTSFLHSFTDRPGALPPGIELAPYISGAVISKYYIISITFPDHMATRAGMVLTHSLIVNLSDIHKIYSIDDLFSKLITDIPSKRTDLQVLEVALSGKENALDVNSQPTFIYKGITSILKGETPVLFSGDLEAYKAFLQRLWCYPDTEFRKRIKFRTSFTPNDLEGVTDLTVAMIQKELVSKWHSYNIVFSTDKELIEITSPVHGLFLGQRSESPFLKFLSDLKVNESDFRILVQCEQVFKDYQSLENILDANIIRQDIRVLSKIAAHNDGNIIKEKFLSRLEYLFATGKDNNIKALRNIDWTGFNNGEVRVSKIVSSTVTRELGKTVDFQQELVADIINLATNVQKDEINWWHKTVSGTISRWNLELSKIGFTNLWRLFSFSEQAIKDTISLMPSKPEVENLLASTMPVDFSSKPAAVIKALVLKKKWTFLYAVISIKYQSLSSALSEQLLIERDLKLSDSSGVQYLAQKMNDKELLDFTLSNNGAKTIALSVDRIVKAKTLLHYMDLSNAVWVEIWSALLGKTKNLSYGIEGREQATAFSILDLLIAKIDVPDNILSYISLSEYSCITDYRNRAKVWQCLPGRFTDGFLNSTATDVLNKLVNAKIKVDSIERELFEKVSDSSFLSNFLRTHNNDMSVIVSTFENFKNLHDYTLSILVANYRGAISESDSSRLGSLVKQRAFTQTAKSIHTKYKHNRSFKTAAEICRELIKTSFFDFIFGDSNKSDGGAFQRTVHIMDPIKTTDKQLPIVVLLTAIKEEYNAVKIHLKDIEDADHKGSTYESGIFEFKGNDIARVIIRECGQKNPTAAQEAERAINYFSPQLILFVGIAGSRKPHDFKIGDVIFPEKISHYEGGKATKDAFNARPETESPTYDLLELAKKERKRNDWLSLIHGTYDRKPEADIGIIASGEQLIDHHDSEIGKILTSTYNDSSVVEMEGFGCIKAAKRQGTALGNIQAGVVRGISDIIASEKDEKDDKNKDRRPANAKLFASDSAAAFAYWLIYKMFK